MQDGPGIRTTVFLKGCSLHCPWCANPENINGSIQYYFKEDVCRLNRGKGSFCSTCPSEKVLKNPYSDKEGLRCPYNAIGVYGRKYDENELVTLLLKDKLYWRETGGVTFSGGEPLLQAAVLKRTLMLLKENKVHTAIETALHVPTHALKTVLEHLDLFIVDLKILDKHECRKILGGEVSLFLKTVSILAQAHKKVIFRIPCSDKFTLADTNLKLLKDLILQYGEYPVEIFSLHRFAEKKYKSLGKLPPDEYPADIRKMEQLASWINSVGGKACIISI